MVINSSYYCFSSKLKCVVENGYIKALPFSADNIYCFYNPFEEKNNSKPLYSIFASLKSDEDILQFVQTYGFLGLNFENINFKNDLQRIRNKTQSWSVSMMQGYSESIECIRKEVFLMNATLELIEAYIQYRKLIDQMGQEIKSTDSMERFNELDKLCKNAGLYEMLQKKIDNVYKYNNRSIENDFEGSTKHPAVVASDLITIELEYKLDDFKHRVYYNNMKGGFVEDRQTHRLITGLYIMIYESLITGKKIVRCANSTCQYWFDVDTNHNKIYCCSECARNQTQREYRRRKKEEKNRKKV